MTSLELNKSRAKKTRDMVENTKMKYTIYLKSALFVVRKGGGQWAWFVGLSDKICYIEVNCRQPLSEQIIRALLPTEDETAKIEEEMKRLGK